MYHLGKDPGCDKTLTSCLTKFVHNGQSCDLHILRIHEVNFSGKSFKFNMLSTLSGIHNINAVFCQIPTFVFFSEFFICFLINLSACSWLFGVWMITFNSFHWIWIIFRIFVIWIMILAAIEFQRHTSFNMFIMADHVKFLTWYFSQREVFWERGPSKSIWLFFVKG